MENIVERIIELCREKKIPVAKLEKDLNYGNGYLNPKKVSDVKTGRLLEILEYLGISPEEFFNIGTKQTQQIESALAQIKKASPEVYEDIMKSWLNENRDPNDEFFIREELRSRPSFRVLFDTFDGATDSDFLEAASVIQRRKEEREP